MPEELFYVGVMSFISIFVILFSVIRMTKKKEVKGLGKERMILSGTLFLGAGIWWFFQTSDGFNQAFGMLCCGAAFIALNAFLSNVLLLVSASYNEQ